MNNNMNCSYDGGDCCGPDVDTTYCSECQCCDDSGCNATSTGIYIFQKSFKSQKCQGKHALTSTFKAVRK